MNLLEMEEKQGVLKMEERYNKKYQTHSTLKTTNNKHIRVDIYLTSINYPFTTIIRHKASHLLSTIQFIFKQKQVI